MSASDPVITSGATTAQPSVKRTSPNRNGPESGQLRLKLPNDRPSPIAVDYAQYGLALGADVDLSSGSICPKGAITPCILGGGGGLGIRGGYRPSGPWYYGGAYNFAKLDSNNLFRLGVFQEARYEMRYYLDFGARLSPYFTWSGGGCIYGNLWGASTGGGIWTAGTGAEFELTRFAVVGLAVLYKPALLVGYTDSTGQRRDTGLTQFLRFELTIELRSELGRE